jgi:ketosteroid isomerase-like protein
MWIKTVSDGLQNLGAEEVELSITGDGSRVFIEQRGNMIVDGRSCRNKYVFRFCMSDGKVSRIREYFNSIIAAYAFQWKIANSITITSLDANP